MLIELVILYIKHLMNIEKGSSSMNDLNINIMLVKYMAQKFFLLKKS
jgi:hypothetical protein